MAPHTSVEDGMRVCRYMAWKYVEGTEDAKEGPQAFLAKRPPQWLSLIHISFEFGQPRRAVLCNLIFGQYAAWPELNESLDRLIPDGVRHSDHRRISNIRMGGCLLYTYNPPKMEGRQTSKNIYKIAFF